MNTKIGERFIVGFPQAEMNTELEKKLLEINPAGIIFYDTNIISAKQVKKLNCDLKELLGNNLLISVDQEGGKVQRLRKITSPLPSYKSLGKVSSEFNSEALIQASKVLAEELVDLGFNLNYAPCLDLNTAQANPIIGSRSLGANPELVAKQGQYIIEAFRSCGLYSCAKHYPGHGASLQDSHEELPRLNLSQDEILAHRLPFELAIEAEVDFIMIAHLCINKQKIPASLNPTVISELREGLNYQGLIVSDEITMKALSSFGNYTAIAIKLLEAGNDLIIWNSNIDDALEASRQELELKPLRELRTLVSTNNESRSTKLLDWAISSIEMKTSRSHKALCEFMQDSNSIIILPKHPKLEIDLVQKIFNKAVISYSSVESLQTELNSYSSSTRFLMFDFHALTNSEEAQAIKFLRQNFPFSIICDTDMDYNDSDLNLNGVGELHFQALCQAALTTI